MGRLKIERIGGLAGFGLPGSKLKSIGERDIETLSNEDRAAVEALFHNKAQQQKPGPERDTYRYRLTRENNGQDETVEVPEAAVPQAVKTCVTDKLM
jgi:hypothetical protein